MEKTANEYEEIIDSYVSRKGQTWKFINRNQKNFQPAEIKGYILAEGKGEVPVFHLGTFKRELVGEKDGYKFYQTEYINDEAEYKNISTPYKTGCQLCGHPIINLRYLINYKTKEYLIVGTECVHNHYGKVVTKKVKEFIVNDLRKEFVSMREYVIPLLEQHLDLDITNSEEQNEYVFRNKRLKSWAYKLIKDLNSIEPEKKGQRKIKNRINLLKNSMKEIENVPNYDWFKPVKKIYNVEMLTNNQDENAIITFGKYKGKKYSEVDIQYLQWAKQVMN